MFRLKMSESVLITDGHVHPIVLDKLISEAWFTEGLYAENKIVYTKKTKINGKFRKEESFATYKELWDCYSNLWSKTCFDPAFKHFPVSLKRDFLIDEYKRKYSENLTSKDLDFGDVVSIIKKYA